jgi:hypothetical protein
MHGVAVVHFNGIRQERLAHKRMMTPDMLEPYNESRREAFQIWGLIQPPAPLHEVEDTMEEEQDADDAEEEEQDVY